jgi:hypothetical protein
MRTSLQETGSCCANYNTNRKLLNKFSADYRTFSGLDDFQTLSFQMQNVSESWDISIN